jgi:hypothetical protein
MARVRLVVHKTWLVQNPPADLDAAIDRAIRQFGMTATRVGDRLEISGGSSRKVKLLGTTLTADSDLPRVGTIERSATSRDSAEERVTLHLEERLNSAIIDAPIRRKYERILEGFAASVEAALSGRGPDAGEPTDGPRGTPPTADRLSEPVVRPAGWWTDVALGPLVKRCHVAGAQRKDIGALVATEAGIAFTGNPKGGCRWEDLTGIEVIELRQGQGAKRQVRRCVRVSSRDGEAGEFWISGRAEPKPVYAIQTLMDRSR